MDSSHFIQKKQDASKKRWPTSRNEIIVAEMQQYLIEEGADTKLSKTYMSPCLILTAL